MTQSPRVVVCALYHFVPLPDFAELRQPLLDLMLRHAVRGTLLLAPEGINGTIAGEREGIDAVLNWLKSDPRLADLDHKESYDSSPPFLRSKVKLKREIVTMGVEGLDPRSKAGTHVEPREWNALLADPELLLIDTRNQYEVEVGSFRGALNPATTSFREFPEFVKRQLDPRKHRKVAMFCTGGIRCEKSTAYLKEQGFEEVYHLKGGILKYLEEVPEAESLWEGECFVFDDRVAVNHRLEKGSWDQCHACRMPVAEADKCSPLYEKGVSCPRCHVDKDEETRAQYRERQRQLDLARARGEAHLGAAAGETLQRRKALKRAAREANARRSAGE